MLRRIAIIIFVFIIAAQDLPLLASERGPCSDKSIISTNVPVIGPPGSTIPPANDSVPAEMQRKQAEARNKERQAALKKDTDELFRLANDLKQKVDQTNENQLSVSVIKATEKIEKLAKSVREKMQANGYCDFVGQ